MLVIVVLRIVKTQASGFMQKGPKW